MGNVCGGESGAPPPDKAEFAQFESSYSPPLEVNDANQKVFFEISIGGTMIGVRLCCCCGFCRLYPALTQLRHLWLRGCLAYRDGAQI